MGQSKRGYNTNLPKAVTGIREEVDVNVSGNVREFLEGMGYRFDFECVRRGTRFKFAARPHSTIEIFQLFKLTKQHALDSEELVRDPMGRPGQKWLVEIGARCEDVKMQQS